MQKRRWLRAGLALLLTLALLPFGPAAALAAGTEGEGQTLTITFNEEKPYILEPSITLNTVIMDPDSYNKIGRLDTPGASTSEGSTTYTWPADQSDAKPLPAGRTENMNTIVIDTALAAEHPIIVLTGETRQYRVRVEEGVTVNLVLRNLRITTQSGRIWQEEIDAAGRKTYTLHDSAKDEYPEDRIYYSAIDIGEGANVTLTLEGENTLAVAALGGAGEVDAFAANQTDPAIHVAGGSLTIGGSGKLTLAQRGVAADAEGGAALLGTAAGENLSGSIAIQNSANITATASGGGAAIGTGAGKSSGGGKIAIYAADTNSCPDVTATAWDGGAAIGSGAGADLRTEIQITGPVEVTAKADGGGAAIGAGKDGDMAGGGMIAVDNGKEDEKREDKTFSPEINATVSGGAAAVIGCGENGSIAGASSDIVIRGTAQIELWENNPTKEGYVPGTAIGVGGYKDGETPTYIPDDEKNTIIDINNTSTNAPGMTFPTMADITIHGNGWIGVTGGKGHDNVYIHDSVRNALKIHSYPDPEDPEDPEEPGAGGGGAFTEPEYYPDYEEEEESLPPEAEEEEARYMVACRALNVRLGPGTGYGKLGALSRGEIVTGEVTDGWLCFLHDGQAAYCSAEYLIPLDGDGRRVLCRALNVRSGPGVEFAKIGELKRGAAVEVLATADGWHKIEYLGGEGYVSAQYVG